MGRKSGTYEKFDLHFLKLAMVMCCTIF